MEKLEKLIKGENNKNNNESKNKEKKKNNENKDDFENVLKLSKIVNKNSNQKNHIKN